MYKGNYKYSYFPAFCGVIKSHHRPSHVTGHRRNTPAYHT